MRYDTSLFKLCSMAITEASNESKIATGFSMKRALEIVKTYTNSREWSREFLFDHMCKTYLAIAANVQGKRSGIKGKGVYFDEESLNQAVADGLVMNAEEIAAAYNTKTEDLRIKRDAIDGQSVMDLSNPEHPENLQTELSLETLVKMIAEDEI